MGGAAFADQVAAYGINRKLTEDEELILAVNVNRQWWRMATAVGSGFGVVNSGEVPLEWFECQTHGDRQGESEEAAIRARMARLVSALGRG